MCKLKKGTSSGEFSNLFAFVKPDKSLVVVVHNETGTDKLLQIKLSKRSIRPLLKAHTFNTFLIR
ncbi:glycoside hydrolase family 30 beta sandwich domain-containing protein [Flavisolibacter ginsengisoli]|uniref:Glycosyl hydrolase family 30 beta sandwich domain-containing protein n=1 Tax=Flavisolibacter ginsengisoli DSM 18119 TaxID=1121884 RepID=A0A1M4VNC5_9BACT|nr:glycoside hydrolase family 30 beta sandwich domain-containing protein [Flavisolibacter ginsengisoli]SHE70340.1 hypothetical protein SAMN02745131_00914 [Flavisolibacter ginsengisoli DSM 18119]